MTDLKYQLQRQFRDQQRFAEGYSPLYARLFGIIADWLADETADPLVAWLVDTSASRKPFDVTLLLLAGLHREVLAGVPAARALSRFYPTAGGQAPVESGEPLTANPPPGVDLPAALRVAILSCRDTLAAFVRGAAVQTNETGRGLAWLLPAACLGWPAIHLVELGASAGLNLVADRRAYRLVTMAEPARTLLELGDGRPAEFTVRVKGDFRIPNLVCCPTILSRTGGDLSPFYLRTAEDEMTLASFVWADPIERMARLREGIAALRRVESSASPVQLRPLHLPHELPEFLERESSSASDAPVVIFNTTVTMYLPDRGLSTRAVIADWAAEQRVPVLWLQWEPSSGEPEPPERGWLAWTADYWPNDRRGESRHWRLAWVHPHGMALQWEPGWHEFLSVTMQN